MSDLPSASGMTRDYIQPMTQKFHPEEDVVACLSTHIVLDSRVTVRR